MKPAPQFDALANSYDEELNQALAATGEDKEYYANGRVRWLQNRLKELSQQPHSILDYGCGIGDTSVLLQQAFEAQSVLGLDESAGSIEVARTRHQSSVCNFMTLAEHTVKDPVDLVYCNGVFHHIPVAMRDSALQYIFRCLRPGGWFAFWENNPWNPGTRHVMAQCAFDADAITITPQEARELLTNAGFQVVCIDFCFLFPRALRLLRFLEHSMARLPLGAQYEVLCRRPVI
ncbi:MAG: methyltransferase domain-containing protein [Terriglobales bacterium]|jgi:trans-aconitate methyltransferase